VVGLYFVSSYRTRIFIFGILLSQGGGSMNTINTINGYKLFSLPITCTDLGLTLEDINFDNLNLLISGICTYGRIYVDKYYTIKIGSKTVSSLSNSQWNLSTKTFELIGLYANCGFNFIWDSTFTPGNTFTLFELDTCINSSIKSIVLDNLIFNLNYIGDSGAVTNGSYIDSEGRV
jgi:hypothetical protein